MKNIVCAFVFASFIASSFFFGMDPEKRRIGEKISLNCIASIPFADGKSVAYLSNNQLLAFKKHERGIHIFDLNNKNQECFDTYIDMGSSIPFVAERNRWGNNVYLNSDICYQTDNKTAIFYSQEKKAIIRSQFCKAVYAGMSAEELNCYMIQARQGKTVKICNLITGEEKNHELLTSFFVLKPNSNLKCFSLATHQVIYQGSKNFFDEEVYFCDVKKPDLEKNVNEPYEYHLSNDGKLLALYSYKNIYWQELVEPYHSGSMKEDIYSKVLGIAIVPYKDFVLSVNRSYIKFWDMRKKACIFYAEADNDVSRVGDRISIAPEGDAFAIISGTHCMVYEMPFIIRTWQWRENFALLHYVLMQFSLNKDMRNLLIHMLIR